MRKILKFAFLLLFSGALAVAQSSGGNGSSSNTGSNSNNGGGQTSNPGTGQPGTGNVPGTGTGQGTGGDITTTPKATKKTRPAATRTGTRKPAQAALILT
jgi:hypothetical protein